MDLAAYRPSLAGRNQRVADIQSVPIGENNGSGVEFSAAETVVEVRQREPAFAARARRNVPFTAAKGPAGSFSEIDSTGCGDA
jgi:hypothetical protein